MIQIKINGAECEIKGEIPNNPVEFTKEIIGVIHTAVLVMDKELGINNLPKSIEKAFRLTKEIISGSIMIDLTNAKEVDKE